MSDDLISDLINDFWVREDDLTEDDGEDTTDYLAELVADLPDDEDELTEDDGDEDSDDGGDDFLAEFMLDADDFLEGLLDE